MTCSAVVIVYLLNGPRCLSTRLDPITYPAEPDDPRYRHLYRRPRHIRRQSRQSVGLVVKLPVLLFILEELERGAGTLHSVQRLGRRLDTFFNVSAVHAFPFAFKNLGVSVALDTDIILFSSAWIETCG